MIASKRIRTLCLTTAASALVLLSAGVSFSQENKITTLHDALSVGIATNPEYGVVAASRRATDEELAQGKALFLPSVDVNGDAGFEHSDNASTRAGTGSDTENLWRKEIGVTLTQMLFDGWAAHYEVQRQEARTVSSADRVRETAELVGLAIVEAYLEVQRQRQLLLIARQNVDSHLDIQKQIEDGISAGRSTQADGEQIKARIAAARANESSTRQALRAAEAQYRAQVGDAAGDLEMPVIPYEVLTQDVDQEVVQALAYNPTLDIFAADIEVAYAEAQATKSTQYPQVDVKLNTRTGEDLGGVEGSNTSASALVVMNWNLYRGGADVARQREFVHRHQQSKESRAKAERAVESDVRQTWASMVSSNERAAQFSAQVSANEEVVKAYQDQFNLDRRTLLDVLDAQNELFVSRSNVINSEFLEIFAVYRLLALKGKLLPTFDVEYPSESVVATGDMWSYKEQQNAR